MLGEVVRGTEIFGACVDLSPNINIEFDWKFLIINTPVIM